MSKEWENPDVDMEDINAGVNAVETQGWFKNVPKGTFVVMPEHHRTDDSGGLVPGNTVPAGFVVYPTHGYNEIMDVLKKQAEQISEITHVLTELIEVMKNKQ